MKQWYKEHPDYIRDYQRANKKRINKLRKEYRKEGRCGHSSHARYRKAHPDRIKARSILTVALNSGKIKPEPCEVCGTLKKIHGHHNDYNKPLEIRWLCRKHHIELHNKQKKVEKSLDKHSTLH